MVNGMPGSQVLDHGAAHAGGLDPIAFAADEMATELHVDKGDVVVEQLEMIHDVSQFIGLTTHRYADSLVLVGEPDPVNQSLDAGFAF